MPSPRSAGLIAVVTVMASLVAQPAATATQATPVRMAKDPASLTELRKEAQRAAKELEEADKALTRRREKVKIATAALQVKLGELKQADLAFAKIRQPVSAMIELLYEQPQGDGVAPFLSGDANVGTLRALSDASAMVAERQLVAEEAGKLHAEQERLAAEAQEIRSGNLLAEAQMAVEIDTLRKRSDKVVKSLTQALVKLGIKIDKVGTAALGCDPTRVTSATEFPNGLIPTTLLCPIQQRGHLLRADAAIAFVSLSEAYRQEFGKPMCVTDAYRTLGEQQSVYYRRPGFAAVPGRSNHGLGLAVDLCGGVERSGSPQFRWMEANSKKFGWMHPDWAYSNPFEPWHWEYDPKIGSLL